jgi:prepilin-type N-terminal cleavage/methylation domain-containing protein
VTKRRSLLRNDRGFTLVELLLVIVILGVIVVPLGTGLEVMLRNEGGVATRLSESHDAQIAASYFGIDALSADVSGTVASGGNSDTRCDGPGTTPIVRFAWTQYNASNTVTSYSLVAYATESGSGSRYTMTRRMCQGTTYQTLSGVPVSSVYISHNLPTLTSWSLSHTSCPEGFKTMTLGVTETSGYSFTASGTRRSASC